MIIDDCGRMGKLLIRNGHIMDPESGRELDGDILISDEGRIVRIAEYISDGEVQELIASGDITVRDRQDRVIDASGCIVTAGLVDPHVHFRDPGQTYKEDIITGSAAAARGGFTSVVMMGNTIPHMDSVQTLRYALDKGLTTGIHTYVCGNITLGMEGRELTDMEALADAGAVLFTDDGKPLCDEELMRQACRRAAQLDMVISLHEENPEYIKENGVNSGEAAEKLGLTGSDRMAEISMVERDIRMAEETGCAITVQHISTAEAVDMIRKAKRRGVRVHAEGTPHHFTLTDAAVAVHGTLAKMNPPLRKESDRLAIIEGLADGTIDMIATDHAPHSAEEKDRPFAQAPSGIIGLETALSLGIRELVRPGYLSMMTLLQRMTVGSSRLYRLPAGSLSEGQPADIVIFDPDAEWTVGGSFASKATNSPFIGETMPGVVRYTICGGRIAYEGR